MVCSLCEHRLTIFPLMSEERSGDFIQSLERGLVVINSFSKERPAQTLSEVAQLTGLTRATVRRVAAHARRWATCTKTGGCSR